MSRIIYILAWVAMNPPNALIKRKELNEENEMDPNTAAPLGLGTVC